LKNNPIIPVLFLAFLFLACNTRPSYVLSETKMEKVLYDVYLAEAEISSNYTVFSSDSARKQELLNSVLKKHKITEAVLDTSLAWYSGHLEKYFKIHENLSKRYAESAETLRKQGATPAIPPNSNIALRSGTMVLPIKKERFLLNASDLPNNAYTFKADTTLSNYGGACELQLHIWGLSASLRPTITLCVQCKDTILIKRDILNHNGLFQTSIDVVKGKQAQKLYGSIYFPQTDPEMNVFIQNFTLSYSFRPLSISQPAK